MLTIITNKDHIEIKIETLTIQNLPTSKERGFYISFIEFS